MTTKKSHSSSRERMEPRGGARYVRRDEGGKFKEVDSVRRAGPADRSHDAQRVSKKGQGDRGDRE